VLELFNEQTHKWAAIAQ